MLSKIADRTKRNGSGSEQKTVKYLLEKDFDERNREQLKEHLRCLNVSLRQLDVISTRRSPESTSRPKRRKKTVSWTNNPLYKKAGPEEVETDCESKNSEFAKSMDSGYKSDTASMKVDVEEGMPSDKQLMECDEFHDAAEELMTVINQLQPHTSSDKSLVKSLKDCEVELAKFSLK